MQLYNTLTKKIETFVPHSGNVVKMYTCGPTVYHYAHIGNMRTYISEDVLEKSLRYIGYDVCRCMNITDVGHLTSDADTGLDKMQVAVLREHKSVLEIAKYYTDAFFSDMAKLNNKMPDIVSPATDNIEMYIEIIKKLLDTGYAYESNGNIYFDTKKSPNYYELSGRNKEDLLVGVRDDVNFDAAKKNPADFVLWFTKSKFDNQELKWESPFGVGYPGWHIECSGIAIKYLGEYLDIHCGAVDSIFPHHTNEIAQSESYLNHKWCNYWVHMEFLNDESGKMSKSKGEFLTVSLLTEKGYNPLAYRLMCLGVPYRKILRFSYDVMDNCQNQYDKLKVRISNLQSVQMTENELTKAYQKRFINAIKDDLNTAQMLTILYDALKDNILSDSNKLFLVNDFDQVLSLDLLKNDYINSTIDQVYINEMIKKRDIAKLNKDYLLADQIREELLQKKIKLIDNREGTTYVVL